MISAARWRARLISSSACRVEVSRAWRPCSAAARPSAMVFCRASIARSSGGQTTFTVNQMNSANATACAISVRLKLIASSLLRNHREQWVGKCKHHGETDADDERRVDQAEKQEHFDLQRVGELRLARRGLEEAAAHHAHADARPRRANADHEADTDAGIGLDHGQKLKFLH